MTVPQQDYSESNTKRIVMQQYANSPLILIAVKVNLSSTKILNSKIFLKILNSWYKSEVDAFVLNVFIFRDDFYSIFNFGVLLSIERFYWFQ
jgi:hypothetical protein